MDTIPLQVSSTVYLALFNILCSMQKSLCVPSMTKFMQRSLDLIGVWLSHSMAWVFDSADFPVETYKDFIAIVKTYTYRQSSF